MPDVSILLSLTVAAAPIHKVVLWCMHAYDNFVTCRDAKARQQYNRKAKEHNTTCLKQSFKDKLAASGAHTTHFLGDTFTN